jgi:hypothetical protein
MVVFELDLLKEQIANAIEEEAAKNSGLALGD